MNAPDLLTAAEDAHALADLNADLEHLDAQARVRWALRTLPPNIVLASSFGAQSAVALHLVTREAPAIPVLLVDTGYLFPETYQFVDALTQKLDLNLVVRRAELSPAFQEARYGRLWEQGVEGINRYNELNKVAPMNRALEELGALSWISGVRRMQSASREHTPVLQLKNGRWKFHPIVDWTDREVWLYLKANDLPYHPLWHEGYVSIGDTHTTSRWLPGMREEDTRFFGLQRECGLHN
jgi:phosphoadenosine phosphosulfate reductase